MEENNNYVLALDIGTRSIIGVVGQPSDGKLKILAIESAEHSMRTMVDGQIDNIRQVAGLARTVAGRLEERLGVKLTKVCVAAAGRALQTQKGSFSLDLEPEQVIDNEIIGRLEAGAVSKAEETLQTGGENWKQLFLVGYTVTQYRLDDYPLSALQDHKGEKIAADVVATFLPGEVVESLYAAMKEAGLQVTSVTLEPIAAMNAAIPSELRLLNLALVDIGAGTTDIAVCREGSVVGYTMATIAGDEITEAIMKGCLVDFATAEKIKRAMAPGETVAYQDILGLEGTIDSESFMKMIQEPMERLCQAVGKQIVDVNGEVPSAVFLAGGGSKLCGMQEKIAKVLDMDVKRVALTGSNFSRTAYSDEIQLDNPEYTTPLGIAVSVGLGLLNDSYLIILNGQPAKLFRSGVLTVRDVLMMNGYTYADMIGRNGKNLNITLDGRRILLRGEPAAPAILTVNDEEAGLGTVVNAGDRIDFIPAQHGSDPSVTLGQFLTKELSMKEPASAENIGRVLVNNTDGNLDRKLQDRDVIMVLEREPAQPDEARIVQNSLEVKLNGKPLVLPPKQSGEPYYMMDMLQYSGIDFAHLDRPVHLALNGQNTTFQDILKGGDNVEVVCI